MIRGDKSSHRKNVTKKDKYLFENDITSPLQKRFSHIFNEE